MPTDFYLQQLHLCWLLALSAQVSVNLGKNFVSQSTFPVHQHASERFPFEK